MKLVLAAVGQGRINSYDFWMKFGQKIQPEALVRVGRRIGALGFWHPSFLVSRIVWFLSCHFPRTGSRCTSSAARLVFETSSAHS